MTSDHGSIGAEMVVVRTMLLVLTVGAVIPIRALAQESQGDSEENQRARDYDVLATLPELTVLSFDVLSREAVAQSTIEELTGGEPEKAGIKPREPLETVRDRMVAQMRPLLHKLQRGPLPRADLARLEGHWTLFLRCANGAKRGPIESAGEHERRLKACREDLVADGAHLAALRDLRPAASVAGKHDVGEEGTPAAGNTIAGADRSHEPARFDLIAAYLAPSAMLAYGIVAFMMLQLMSRSVVAWMHAAGFVAALTVSTGVALAARDPQFIERDAMLLTALICAAFAGVVVYASPRKIAGDPKEGA